ncbi:sphingomyelin phosphodiesterase 1-like [Bicyclus anynana]|uniref:Sphingomyelin phosphodiesterase n=1 Tax=Bicyclus anynana TaxID=110368 RepID=A0A6J1ML14_BICAN|nr:sphingomyelin phosphodiesterase 1-like [Bicyclus anynana]
MNVLNIIVFSLFCVYSIAADSLGSNDLANLFIRHSRDELLDSEAKVIEDILQLYGHVWNNARSVTKGIRCFVCRGAFAALMALIKLDVSDEAIINTATKLCSIAISERVCRGFIGLNLPILKYIIKKTPQATPKTFCGVLLQSYQQSHTCEYDDPRFEWQIELPPKVNQRDHLYYDDDDYDNNLSPLTVAVLSDIHVDMFYESSGVADCDEPICCRKGQTPRVKNILDIDEDIQECVVENDEEILLDTEAASKIVRKDNKTSRRMSDYNSKPAGYWGDYRNCDTPLWSYVDVLKQIASHKEIDVVYYLGDNIDHHIWETTYELVDEVNSLIADKMKNTFQRDILVIPTIGNHDSQPVNQFAPTSITGKGLNTTWLYKSLATKWRYYLSKEASGSMKCRGGFSMLIRPGLRVISINNNVAYKLNWWVLYDPVNPKRHLEWLVEELHNAELSGEKVHILSHIPPGDQDLIYVWTREYDRIVERFSSTIVAQFYGHVHSDDFKIFYKDGKAFNVAWGAGSVSTYQNLNPNYKIVTFDNDNFETTSITNYIYNLTEANLTPDKSPRWFKLYDMKDSFQLHDLSATSMNQLVYSMVTDRKFLLDDYAVFSSKQSDLMPYCDTDCKIQMICNSVTSVLWDRKECNKLIDLYFS